MTYDTWKTTEPTDTFAEWEDALDAAELEADRAFDDAADWASLFAAAGFDDGPDPVLASQRARANVLTAARRGLGW